MFKRQNRSKGTPSRIGKGLGVRSYGQDTEGSNLGKILSGQKRKKINRSPSIPKSLKCFAVLNGTFNGVFS